MQVKLQFPVSCNNVTVEEVTLRRLTVGDLKRIPKEFYEWPEGVPHNPSDFIPMLAAMTGLSEEVVAQMDLEDFNQVFDAAQPFLPKSPKTGKS